jgi:SPX domain protein involved in polyphosphate accumulation
MHFSQTLRAAIYPPWRDKYIDYAKLKSLLREDAAHADDTQPWTEADENAFCDEILNVQLEKVATFQESSFKSLLERADRLGEQLREMAPATAPATAPAEEGAAPAPRGELTAARLREIEEALDAIVAEMRELKKYSAINYTGFLKIVKKHDRKRGSRYRLRPLVMVSLAKRPFNSEEGYAPLANKLSMLYWAVRQQVDGAGEGEGKEGGKEKGEEKGDGVEGEKYNAYKCAFISVLIWV